MTADLLSSCDREPIHIPGAIQSHGALVAFEGMDHRVSQVSANAAEWLGTAELLGRPLASFVEGAARETLLRAFKLDDPRELNPLRLTVNGLRVDALVHRSGTSVVLELECRGEDAGTDVLSLFAQVRASLSRFVQAPSMEALAQVGAEEVRRLTGFDRVMVYRFDADWNGEVVAESLKPGVDSFSGLHFPATDIPVQARRLYELSTLRLIADVQSTPVALLKPPASPPLDLSHANLRAVSPIHIEYLRNMEVGASMSVSLLENGKLWGLMACHHASPLTLSFETRAACDFVGQLLSGELVARTRRAFAEERSRQLAVQGGLVEAMSREAAFLSGLESPALLEFVDASGAVAWLEGGRATVGKVPDEAALTALVAWLDAKETSDVFATRALAAAFPEAAAYASLGSGLLAVPLSQPSGQWMLWFRPESVEEVTWAGTPEKAEDVNQRMSPRKSFAAWKQTVRHRSRAWSRSDLEAARDFRGAMVGVVLRKAAELAALNAQLARSNQELDAFTLTATHDLKEPLRGVRNYASFVLEDEGPKLSEAGRSQLQLIESLADKMDGMLDGLFHFSRVGRVELAVVNADLQVVVEDVIALLGARLDENRVKVDVPRRLPVVTCDEVRVREVFANLLSNAAKYQDPEKAEHRIEVGYDAARAVFHVKDNGIGISPRYHVNIFGLFKRLHPEHLFGGGTGAGLTIAKQIVERHGGRLWVESQLGQGATFFFTLGPAQ